MVVELLKQLKSIENLNARKDEILKIINNIKTQEDPVITDARNEIKRLRALAEQQIADSK